MNQRRSFLRNITLAIAASLLPKILQPITSEIEEERMILTTVYSHRYKWDDERKLHQHFRTDIIKRWMTIKEWQEYDPLMGA